MFRKLQGMLSHNEKSCCGSSMKERGQSSQTQRTCGGGCEPPKITVLLEEALEFSSDFQSDPGFQIGLRVVDTKSIVVL